MTTTVAMGEPDDYLDRLCAELKRVGIRGALRERILAEVADHLVDGDVEDFGEPKLIAQRFADELATAYGRRAAFRGFGALALAGAGFAASWLLVPAAGGWTDITATRFLPLALAAALGMVVCSQVSFAAGVLALLRALRLRHASAAPAAEVALLLRRTRTALVSGALAMASLALFAVLSRGDLASWYVLTVAPAALLLTVPLAVAGRATSRAAELRASVPGPAGDVFDDLPVGLPHRPWALCLAVATLVAVAALLAGGVDEGPRNAVAEFVLVVAGFAALGRRLGLRR
jgi:hypothetical protein